MTTPTAEQRELAAGTVRLIRMWGAKPPLAYRRVPKDRLEALAAVAEWGLERGAEPALSYYEAENNLLKAQAWKSERHEATLNEVIEALHVRLTAAERLAEVFQNCAVTCKSKPNQRSKTNDPRRTAGAS